MRTVNCKLWSVKCVSIILLTCMHAKACYFQFNLVWKDLIILFCIIKYFIIRVHKPPRHSFRIVSLPRYFMSPSRTISVFRVSVLCMKPVCNKFHSQCSVFSVCKYRQLIQQDILFVRKRKFLKVFSLFTDKCRSINSVSKATNCKYLVLTALYSAVMPSRLKSTNALLRYLCFIVQA